MKSQRQADESSVFADATIGSLICRGHADSAALHAPNRPHLTYERLRKQLEYTVGTLNGLGIGRNDRVAIVLPNGPELACAFLGVAAGASAAPLNPAYRQDDFHFYLSDLGAKALLVQRNCKSPALAAAAALRVPVLEIDSRPSDAAGSFSIFGEPIGESTRQGGFATSSDIALVLHTSGTTSRPKLVPLSHRNLTASAGHIVESLGLTAEDRCLSIMPLFHIHGLVAGVLSPLAAGSLVFCMPGSNTQEMFFWMEEAKPTWYTAVPTLHQALLARARENPRTVERIRLRFIRSSSAPLPPAVMRDLESTFNAPVIESYGMTEAAHQMASNPLPPRTRKPGSVGQAAGPEIAIMDSSGTLLPPGVSGEVVIRGPNVMTGYANNPQANAAAFASGWFRTGDIGSLDAEGYLTITGRLKEIINRGGQKISPREVDDALMDYPGVAGAATFPIPHPTLGEEIGAALKAGEGATLTEQGLLDFLRGRLPDFKIPRRFVFVEDIPKGPTGKIQRRDLAEVLGVGEIVNKLRASADTNEPLTPLEARLSELWKQILQMTGSIDVHEDFFMLGGDSLQAVELLALIEWKLGHALPQSVFIEHGTIVKMAEYISRQGPSPCLVPIQPKGSRPPFFCVSHVEGEVLSLRNLARRLGEDQPFYGIQAVGIDGKQAPLTRVEDMAAQYLREIRLLQPTGPYYLGGYSMGGMVAFEMVRQLKAQGEQVGLLALIDASCGPARMRVVPSEWLLRRWKEVSNLRASEISGYVAYTLSEAGKRVSSIVVRKINVAKWRLLRLLGKQAVEIVRPKSIAETNAMAAWAYRIEPCECNAVLLKTELYTWQDPANHDGWKDIIGKDLEIRNITGSHYDFLSEPNVKVLAAQLQECLETQYSRYAATPSSEPASRIPA